MTTKKKRSNNTNYLIEAIKKWPNPIYDSRHGYYIFIEEGRARTNETRIEHIVRKAHDLKVRDLELIPSYINRYVVYKKDPVYKDTFNYYLNRKGQDKGFIKISVQLDHGNRSKGWIKTIYITYKIK